MTSKKDEVRQNLLGDTTGGDTPGEYPPAGETPNGDTPGGDDDVKTSEQEVLTREQKLLLELEEEINQMGHGQTCRFFCKHSCRDLGRNKCHFCLAFMSVFIVVLSTLVIHSVVSKGPIIFMTLGQQQVGAFDGLYLPASDPEPFTKLNTYSQTRNFINFNKVQEVISPETYNLAPRFHICEVELSYTDERTGCFMALDLAHERTIDLAPNFPFSELAQDECLFSSEHQDLYGLNKG